MMDEFFDEPAQRSLVKTAIVTKYFAAWALIMSVNPKLPRIGYIDLFAGPGRYDDGTPSTPIKVLEIALANPKVAGKLVTFFSDENTTNVENLKKEVSRIHGIGVLPIAPQVEVHTVGSETAQIFSSFSMIPCLTFLDPFGYKGLSQELFAAFQKGWGCDLILFFNYNRVNAAITNPKVAEHIDAIFGKEESERLKARVQDKKAWHREALVIEALCEKLKSLGAKFVLPFRFKDLNGKRTSHHLVFSTKHFRGYEIMKDIMAKESSDFKQGVASFEYSPADDLPQTSLLFKLAQPLDVLQDQLLAAFPGQTLTMKEIYERHSIDKPYVSKNYKGVLSDMECRGMIKADPPAAKRRKNTFADDVKVTFPERAQD